jgi:hypothetical protein
VAAIVGVRAVATIDVDTAARTASFTIRCIDAPLELAVAR